MIPSFPALHAIRLKIATVAVGGIVLTAGHALAINHDLQPISLSRVSISPHDHAPGPGTRPPQ